MKRTATGYVPTGSHGTAAVATIDRRSNTEKDNKKALRVPGNTIRKVFDWTKSPIFKYKYIVP